MTPPIILVGLPRSGSTLVSRILNESANCLITNDFYYLQYVESIGAYTKSDHTTKGLLVDFIVDQVKNRTKPNDLEDEVWFGLPFSDAELDKIFAFAEVYKADARIKTWAQVLQDIMQFLAELANKPVWGYNTPQDYLNFNIISEAFPNAKFIFLLRSPLATLLSYKYYWTVDPKFQDDRGRYHPVIQSLAWRVCATTYFRLKKEHGQSRCMLVKFEDVLNNTDKVLAEISRFADVKFLPIDLKTFGHNSSLSSRETHKKVKTVTGLEAKICHIFTQNALHRLGYDDFSIPPIGLADVFSLLVTTYRNFLYYFRQVTFSRNVRKRVFRFMSHV